MCLFHLLRHAWPTVTDLAQEGLVLSTEHGFPLSVAAFTVSQNLARTMRSRRKEDIERNIEECLSSYPALGIDLNLPWNRTMIAENYGRIKHPDEGLAVLAEGFTVMERTEERHHEAEMWRVKGELLLQKTNGNKTKAKAAAKKLPDVAAEAEACFLKALAVAQQQRAKSFELRAAISLGRFWKTYGKRESAWRILTEVCDWFTEGFETEDFKQAKTLLCE
jgi:hypothetical protein